MKKFLIIFAGFSLLTISAVSMFISGAIYNVAEKTTTVPFFFQPDLSAGRRMEEPESMAQIGEIPLRNKLIQKFVTEYFYVIPDFADIEYRKNGPFSSLRLMSYNNVFDKWKENIAPELTKLVEDRVLQVVSVDPNAITKNEGTEKYHVRQPAFQAGSAGAQARSDQ